MAIGRERQEDQRDAERAFAGYGWSIEGPLG
jgi:hypothetical protein